MAEPFKIILAAGGTGGHIYPALALGEALRAAEPTVALKYFCGSRAGELGIYRSALGEQGEREGIELVALPMTGRRRGVANTIQFAREFVSAYRMAGREVRAFGPDLAVGFGNYVSVPVLWHARRRGAKTAVQEQNSLPGAANRWLARGADLVFTGMPVAAGVFPAGRVIEAGNPVRAGLLRPVDPGEAREALGLPREGRVCLCFGGSLGAAGVNRIIQQMIPLAAAKSLDSAGEICHPPDAAGETWRFIWAAGRDHHPAAEKWLLERPELRDRVRLFPYIDFMEKAYAAADLVLSRAGALTLAELAALGKASILIPLPHAAGDHQRGNARTMAQAGAAEAIEEADPEAAKKIAEMLNLFARNGDKLHTMSASARRMGKPEAAMKMAESILAMLKRDRLGEPK